MLRIIRPSRFTAAVTYHISPFLFTNLHFTNSSLPAQGRVHKRLDLFRAFTNAKHKACGGHISPKFVLKKRGGGNTRVQIAPR